MTPQEPSQQRESFSGETRGLERTRKIKTLSEESGARDVVKNGHGCTGIPTWLKQFVSQLQFLSLPNGFVNWKIKKSNWPTDTQAKSAPRCRLRSKKAPRLNSTCSRDLTIEQEIAPHHEASSSTSPRTGGRRERDKDRSMRCYDKFLLYTGIPLDSCHS